MGDTKHTDAAISERLRDLSQAGSALELEEFIHQVRPIDLIRSFSRLSAEQQVRVLTTIRPGEAADLLEDLPRVQATTAIEQLPAASAAAIISELPADEGADLVGQLAGDDAAAILAAMGRDDAKVVRELAAFPANSAGALMTPDVLSFGERQTVGAVIEDLARRGGDYSEFAIQYLYLVSTQGVLVGILPLRTVVLAPRDAVLSAVMVAPVQALTTSASIEEIRDFFDLHRYLGVPIVDARGRLCGVVRRDHVAKVMEERADAAALRMAGVVEEEFRSMSATVRARRRLTWLSGNIVLNLLAAGVIASFEDTLKSVIALAVFMPIISDMSGCSGNQAVAVSMRELALGLLRPHEVARVVGKEFVVGVVNGLVLGLLVGLIAYTWQGNPWFGLVVGGALALNTVVAVICGGSIPLLLRLAGKDPALASGPLLTTITDMCGFFLMLSLAEMLMPRLQ